jgi:hypothetical protein
MANMNRSFLLELTASERAAINDAVARDRSRAIDRRSDGAPDCDGLCDARRVGERIADGFAMLNGSE